MPEASHDHGTVIRVLTTMASMILALSGTLCLFLGGFTFYKALPRDGRPPPALTRTDTRAMSLAILVLVLMLGGGMMLVKGLVGISALA
jgi:hypothetical protein